MTTPIIYLIDCPLGETPKFQRCGHQLAAEVGNKKSVTSDTLIVVSYHSWAAKSW